MNQIIETLTVICVYDGPYLTVTLAFRDLSHRFVVQLMGIHDVFEPVFTQVDEKRKPLDLAPQHVAN